jgi:phosphoribosyl-AMP cyclohydrolase
MLANCHVGKMSCWQIVSWGIVTLANCKLAKCHVGELSCWRTVMLAKCHVGKLSSWWIVTLTNCHVGEMSCWQIVMFSKCHVDEMSCWQPCNTCTLTFFPPWNSCTDACSFNNEHDGQNFTAPLYFTPWNNLRQAAWRTPWLRQPPWLAWCGKIFMPRPTSRICDRREIAWRMTNAAHCCETHTNFYGAQLRVLANQAIPFYIVSPLF